MKRKIALLVCLGALLILSSVSSGLALEYFEILDYDIQITVHDNNSYDVTENIRVEYSEPRHGIYRFIPRKHNDRTVRITDVSVSGYDFVVNRDAGSDYVNIRIGSADYFVDGIKTYPISYTYTMGKDYLPDYDEFYFNLIGPDWDTTIHNVTFSVTMPHDFDASQINITSGAWGSTDSSNNYFEVNGRTITGGSKTALGPNEAFTFALTLPEGYYTSAKDNNAAFYWMRGLIYALSVILLGWGFVSWARYGKDVQLTPVVGFYPPNGMTPAEVGYIVDGSIDNRDIISLIIHWASRGYLQIEEHSLESDSLLGRLTRHSETSFSFTKVKNADAGMEPYEASMFDQLFDYGDGTTVYAADLEKSFYSTVNATKSRIANTYKSSEKRLYTKKSRRRQGLVAASSVLPAVLLIFALLGLELGFGFFTGMFSLMLGTLMVLPIILIMAIALARLNLQPRIKLGTILLVVLSAVPTLLVGFLLSAATMVSALDVICVTGSCLGLNMLAAAMPQRSAFATNRLNKILGFRNFLEYAEKPRLEALVEDNPSYYYETMAYAWVLGVSDKWAEKFESIAIEPPEWYSGYRANYFRPHLFGRHLYSSMSSIQTSMTSMPSRSSSGGGGGSFGGGFSGGGGGGGGGGSW